MEENNEKWEIIQDGEPNIYFVKNNKTWLFRIKLNGELTTQKQLEIVQLMVNCINLYEVIKEKIKNKLNDFTRNN